MAGRQLENLSVYNFKATLVHLTFISHLLLYINDYKVVLKFQ